MSAFEQLSLGIGLADLPEARPHRRTESTYSKPTPEAQAGSGDSRVRARAGAGLARAALNSNPPQIEVSSSVAKSSVRHFEKLAAERINRFLLNPNNRPLLSFDERELLIRNPDSYFASIRDYVKPSLAGDEGLLVRQNRAEAKARKGRTKAYSEALVDSLVSVDNCRSWRWYLINGNFQPIKPKDSPEDIKQRVAVDLASLLTAARGRGMLVGGHSHRVVDSLVDRFDGVSNWLAGDGQSAEEIKLAVDLTVLVGRNGVLKTNLWLNRLPAVSKGYRIFDPDLPKILDEYNRLRPAGHRQRFDPLKGLLPRLAKNDRPKAD